MKPGIILVLLTAACLLTACKENEITNDKISSDVSTTTSAEAAMETTEDTAAVSETTSTTKQTKSTKTSSAESITETTSTSAATKAAASSDSNDATFPLIEEDQNETTTPNEPIPSEGNDDVIELPIIPLD